MKLENGLKAAAKFYSSFYLWSSEFKRWYKHEIHFVSQVRMHTVFKKTYFQISKKFERIFTLYVFKTDIICGLCKKAIKCLMKSLILSPKFVCFTHATKLVVFLWNDFVNTYDVKIYERILTKICLKCIFLLKGAYTPGSQNTSPCMNRLYTRHNCTLDLFFD